MRYSIDALGNRIRNERNKRNLTIEEFAELIQVSSSYLGLIERGERHVSLNTLIQISESLNIPIDHFLLTSDSEPSDRTKYLSTQIENLTDEQFQLVSRLIHELNTYFDKQA